MSAELSQLHLRFQRSLLGLLRKQDPSRQLAELGELSRMLGSLTTTAPAAEFWSLLDDLLRSADTGDSGSDAALLRLLGAAERQLKCWLQDGEQCFARGDGKALIWKLRDQLATSQLDADSGPETGPDPQLTDDAGHDAQMPEAHGLGEKLRDLASHPAWQDQTVPEDGANQLESVEKPKQPTRVDEAGAAERGDNEPDQARPEPHPKSSPESREGSATRPASSLKARPGTLVEDAEPELVVSDRVPFSNTLPRLRWVGRQACRTLARHAQLQMQGDGLVDRSLLKQMLASLESLVRNTVYFGVESGDRRLSSGRAPVATITVTYHQHIDGPYLSIRSDGLALDSERLTRKAREQGLLEPDQQPDQAQLLALLTAPGFSTAHPAARSAGYGVGLDKVAATLAKLGCRFEIDAGPGDELRFRIILPTTTPPAMPDDESS